MKKYSERMLKLGARVEREHTKNPLLARKIARDHLKEFGNRYYPSLLKMERGLRRKKR